jgi:hypothetical protein
MKPALWEHRREVKMNGAESAVASASAKSPGKYSGGLLRGVS